MVTGLKTTRSAASQEESLAKTFRQFLMDNRSYVFPAAQIKVDAPHYAQLGDKYLQQNYPIGAYLVTKGGTKAADWNSFRTGFTTRVTSLAASTNYTDYAARLETVQDFLDEKGGAITEYARAREAKRERKRDLYEMYLNGEYRSVEHAAVLVPLADSALIYDHQNKHFQGRAGSDAQYSKSKGYVAALEAKAVRLGLMIGGAIYFKHSETVGRLGTRHSNEQTACIRVDSPGGETQHSHPFPESLSGGSRDDTHDSLIAALIVRAATFGSRKIPEYADEPMSKDLKRLALVAKYLADIGGHQIVLSSDQKKFIASTGNTLPACSYWR